MNSDISPTRYPSLSLTYAFIFAIGLSCMGVAGFFLIEGLSQFAGNDSARNMLITGGVLFQITESVCFIAAAALTYHSLRWRYILFALGSVLFAFSIGVMTLAQKTALQTGEAQASAIDERRGHLREQIASLEKVIDSYRFNAEKQSRSIYKDSRALGQDSINRATELEERKMKLSDALFEANKSRRQTSADFFNRLQDVTGLPAKSAEFYFLVLRSLLLELSGIILMSFGANLRAYKQLVIKSEESTDISINTPLIKRIMPRKAMATRNKQVKAVSPQPGAAAKSKLQKKVRELKNETGSMVSKPKKPLKKKNAEIKHQAELPNLKRAKERTLPEKDDVNEKRDPQFWQSPDEEASGLKAVPENTQPLNLLATMVADLHEQNLLATLEPDSIMKGLSRYCSENISRDTAGVLSKMMNNRLDESC